MLRPGDVVDEYIIKENKHKVTQIPTEDVIHQSLKHRWGVRQSERHEQELVALVRLERRLLHIVEVHAYLVIAGSEVELGEEPRAVELVKELLDHRNRELVFDGDGAEGTIIHTKALHFVCLIAEEHRRREHRRAQADDALVQHLGALGLELILLQLRVAVCPHRHLLCASVEVDAVVVTACKGQAGKRGKQVG